MAGINLKHIWQSAKAIIHAALGRVIPSQLDAQGINELIQKGVEISKALHEKKLSPELLADAEHFLNGLLQGLHVANLTDEEVQEIVDKAVALATEFHKQKE